MLALTLQTSVNSVTRQRLFTLIAGCVYVPLQAGVPPLAPQCTGPPEASPPIIRSVGRVSERLGQWEDGERLCPADTDGWRAEGAV